MENQGGTMTKVKPMQDLRLFVETTGDKGTIGLLRYAVRVAHSVTVDEEIRSDLTKVYRVLAQLHDDEATDLGGPYEKRS
jgi:hypothetical protein